MSLSGELDVALGRIEVLGHRLVLPQGPASEGYHPAAEGVYRENDPLPELVHQFPAMLVAEAGGKQVFRLITVLQGGPGQCRGGRFSCEGPSGGGPSQPEFAYRLIGESPLLPEVGQSHGMSLRSIEQGVRIEPGGKFRNGYHRLPLEAVGRILGALLLLVDLYPVFAGKVLQSLGVGHLLVLHDEPCRIRST